MCSDSYRNSSNPYLGHVSISATQRYLTMTPDLLYQASMRFERYARPTETYHD